MSTTFITAFFNFLPTWHPNYESKFNGYKEASIELLTQDIHLVFVGDERMASHVIETRKAADLLAKTFVMPLEFSSLPLAKHLGKIVDICDYESPPTEFTLSARFTPGYFVTILSKMGIVQKISQLNIFDSTYFLWIDFGYFHHKKEYPYAFSCLPNDVFSQIEKSMNGDLFRISAPTPPKASLSVINSSDESKKSYYKIYQKAAAGCLFGGSKKAIDFVFDKYNQELDWILENNFITAEENIFSFLLMKYPDAFDVFVSKYTTVLNNFSSQTINFEYVILQIGKFCACSQNHAELSNCLRILDAVKRGDFKTDMAKLYNYICISAYYIDRELYLKYKAEALLYFETHKLRIEPRILKNLSY
jgi:hypothetical protein